MQVPITGPSVDAPTPGPNGCLEVVTRTSQHSKRGYGIIHLPPFSPAPLTVIERADVACECIFGTGRQVETACHLIWKGMPPTFSLAYAWPHTMNSKQRRWTASLGGARERWSGTRETSRHTEGAAKREGCAESCRQTTVDWLAPTGSKPAAVPSVGRVPEQ